MYTILSTSKIHRISTLTHSLRHLIYFTLLVALSNQARSVTDTIKTVDERWYQIETVIFTQQSEGNNEHWYHHNPIHQSDTPIELIDPLSPKKVEQPKINTKSEEIASPFEAFTYLNASEQHKLPTLIKRLKRSKAYRVLFEGSWKQSLDKNDSLPIHVQGGNRYNEMSELDGYLRLSVNRYLHITTNLQLTLFDTPPKKKAILDNPMQSIDFRQPDWAAKPAWNPALFMPEFIPMENIIFKQSRRMRSKELHYLDNPRLGLLIYITPLKAPDSNEITEISEANI